MEKIPSLYNLHFFETSIQVNYFQKAWVYLQFQSRWTEVSIVSSQKEQESTCFMPILQRKSFVAILLFRNLKEYSELGFLYRGMADSKGFAN